METASTMLTTWMERVWNQLDTDAITELFAADGLAHGLGPEPLVGPSQFLEFHAGLTAAFKDIRITVLDQIVDGDRVCGRWTATMTHRATGKTGPLTGIAIATVKNGQMQEAWNSNDMVPMLELLGHLPETAVAEMMTG